MEPKQPDNIWFQRIREVDASLRSSSSLTQRGTLLLKFQEIAIEMVKSKVPFLPLATIIDTFRSALSADHIFVKGLIKHTGLQHILLRAAGLAHAVAGRMDDACEAYLTAAELGN